MSHNIRKPRSSRALGTFGLFLFSGFSGPRISGKSWPTVTAGFLLITLSLATLSNPLDYQGETKAHATLSGDKVGLYLSAPMVQGSGVVDSVKENFNNLNVGACPTSVAGVSSMTFRNGSTVVTSGSDVQNVCKVGDWTRSVGASVGEIYGGASNESALPTFGGDGTRYMAIPFYNPGPERSITFNLSASAKYVGFWWSGGNNGNTVRFLDDAGNLVAEMKSETISAKLAAPRSGSVTSIGGSDYVKDSFYGNPVYYSDLNTKPGAPPGVYAGFANEFIFTYLNIFVEGSLNIRKIQFAGPGFEFDNLAISTVQQTPELSMVEILKKNSADLAWNPSTSLLRSAGSASPTPATTTGNGNVSYSVKSQGGTVCSVNASTGVLTYSAVGDCVVTATSSETSTTFSATKDVTFVISNQIVEAPGKPGTPTVVVGSGSATISVVAPTTGGTPDTYTVTANPGGLTCSVTPPATSCAITGLTNGTNYTFTSVANNAGGPSVASDSSLSVRPVLAPSTPGTPTATAGNASATLSWEPSATGTAPITYTVETIPSGGTCVVANSGLGTTASCTGLTNGVSYQFQVTATNGPSSSATSGTSTSITPVAPPAPTQPVVTPPAPTERPQPPNNSDVTLSEADESLRVARAPSAPVAVARYLIKLSPGGRGCELATGASFCEITGAKHGVEYKVLLTASNALGNSKPVALDKKVILTSAGWLELSGQLAVKNFDSFSSALSAKQKARIAQVSQTHKGAKHTVCTGYAAGAVVNERTLSLAVDRAKKVCSRLENRLGATENVMARVPGLRETGANRKVVIKVYSALK